jgi:hypothetical protein
VLLGAHPGLLREIASAEGKDRLFVEALHVAGWPRRAPREV